MAQRFVSGIYTEYANNNSGRFFTRFLVEWLTQVVGWSVVDFSSAKWNNVLASGASTASAIAADILEITSPSYVFSSTNELNFITLTGFTGGNASRNGIYRIRRHVSTVGSVYTLKIFKINGVHHEGLPIQSGLNWRLWQANDTYCPTLNTEYAVIGGKGNVGAGLANGMRSSVPLSITQSGSTSTLVDIGATFQASDVGKSITVAGSSVPGNNTTSIIASRVSPTTITFTNASGGNDNSPGFTGSWNITYDFHVRIRAEVSTLNYYPGNFPGISIAPWASWNNVSHTWNDNRYTVEKTISYEGYLYGYGNAIAFYAEADIDHFTFCITYSRVYSEPHVQLQGSVYLLTYGCGELNPFYPETDPRPIWLWIGAENTACHYFERRDIPIIGTNLYESSNPGSNRFFYRDRFYGLGSDDLTTLTYYATFVHSLPSTDSHMLHMPERLFSNTSEKFYRVPIIAECRTSGNMEMRGTFRQMWAVNMSLPLGHEQGPNGEYAHLAKGIMVPWNGSRCAQLCTGQSCTG